MLEIRMPIIWKYFNSFLSSLFNRLWAGVSEMLYFQEIIIQERTCDILAQILLAYHVHKIDAFCVFVFTKRNIENYNVLSQYLIGVGQDIFLVIHSYKQNSKMMNNNENLPHFIKIVKLYVLPILHFQMLSQLEKSV